MKHSSSCPLCGSAMAEKDGKYGRFLSCLRFPQCKGALNLPGTQAEASAAPVVREVVSRVVVEPVEVRQEVTHKDARHKIVAAVVVAVIGLVAAVIGAGLLGKLDREPVPPTAGEKAPPAPEHPPGGSPTDPPATDPQRAYLDRLVKAKKWSDAERDAEVTHALGHARAWTAITKAEASRLIDAWKGKEPAWNRK